MQNGKLRSIIESAKEESGLSLGDLTVLATQNDPYRLDTPAGHRVGAWCGEQFDRFVGPNRRNHCRGLFYAIVSAADVEKPDGTIFANSDDDWEFLQSKAVKAGRWLGYVPFEGIRDERNAPPVIYANANNYVPDLVVEQRSIFIPSFDFSLAPQVNYSPPGAKAETRQPYHLVIFGEKSSIGDVVRPLALRCGADVYLANGEISDTLIRRMVSPGDDRELIVFCIADSDPSGHQMAVSIARKLQAFRDLSYPDLRFQVRPIALTIDQVKDLNLPSTPLKETERRKDRWMAAYGVQQTEIDALAQLRPDIMSAIVRDALSPFYDFTLRKRTEEAQKEWFRRAREALGQCVNHEAIEAIRTEAEGLMDTVSKRLAELDAQLDDTVDTSDLEWPEIKLPVPDINTDLHGRPLLSSEWSWADGTRALIDRKKYR